MSGLWLQAKYIYIEETETETRNLLNKSSLTLEIIIIVIRGLHCAVVCYV